MELAMAESVDPVLYKFTPFVLSADVGALPRITRYSAAILSAELFARNSGDSKNSFATAAAPYCFILR
jgi:hypothetical protein